MPQPPALSLAHQRGLVLTCGGYRRKRRSFPSQPDPSAACYPSAAIWPTATYPTRSGSHPGPRAEPDRPEKARRLAARSWLPTPAANNSQAGCSACRPERECHLSESKASDHGEARSQRRLYKPRSPRAVRLATDVHPARRRPPGPRTAHRITLAPGHRHFRWHCSGGPARRRAWPVS